jgi:hypothetical protein
LLRAQEWLSLRKDVRITINFNQCFNFLKFKNHFG